MDSIKRSNLALALLAVLSLAGCATRSTEQPTEGNSSAGREADQYPLIVRLVGRHYTVTASSSPRGVVYSAEGTDGRLIVANATLDELRLRHPDIYQQILPGVATKGEAENARSGETAEDASIDGPIPLGHVNHPASGTGASGERFMLHSAR
jgi:hypothetical protein